MLHRGWHDNGEVMVSQGFCTQVLMAIMMETTRAGIYL